MDEGEGGRRVVEVPGYRIGRRLGRGAFATVYVAHQESVGRDVALKVIEAVELDATTLRRFRAEIRSAGQLHWHPHVVDVFDGGITEDGRPYLAMELVAGGSWGDRVRSGPVAPEDVVRVGVEVADALGAAHEAGVLHRDVKPDNILIGRRGESLLSDFGIAVLADGTRSTTGSFTGTLAYTAPELLRGERASPASDAFALGATLYALAAGHHAFAPAGDEAPYTIMWRIAETEPDPLPGTVAPALRAAITGALAKDPAERWTVARIEAALRARPEPPPPPPDPAPRPRDEVETVAVPPPPRPSPRPRVEQARPRSRATSVAIAVLVVAVVALAALLVARGDDGEGEAGTTTTRPDGTGTGAEVDEGVGSPAAPSADSLAGWKGTTPLAETTPAVEALRERMREVDPDLEDFTLGPESYDAAIVIALAARIAGDDGSAHAAEIVGVTTGGERCTTYAACLAIVDDGGDIDYDGASGPLELSGDGEPTIGTYGVLQFGADDRIDPSATTFRTVDAPPSITDAPLAETRADRPGNGVLTLGTLLPDTGNLAFIGPPAVAGVEVAVEEINAAGGFNGTDVVLSQADSGDTTTDIASASVDRLLGEDVDAIVGTASSGVTLTVIDAVVGAGVTLYSPANTTKELTGYDDAGLYFRNGPSDVLQGLALAEVIAEDGISRIAIVHLDDSYGNGLAEDLTGPFVAAGGEVLDTVAYPPDEQAFATQVDRLLAADPEAVVVIGFEESGRIVAELIDRGRGPTDLPTYGTDGNMGNATSEEFASVR